MGGDADRQTGQVPSLVSRQCFWCFFADQAPCLRCQKQGTGAQLVTRILKKRGRRCRRVTPWLPRYWCFSTPFLCACSHARRHDKKGESHSHLDASHLTTEIQGGGGWVGVRWLLALSFALILLFLLPAPVFFVPYPLFTSFLCGARIRIMTNVCLISLFEQLQVGKPPDLAHCTPM